VIAACILAGGRATRLGGRAKPALIADGATILERQLDVLAPRVATVLVSVAPGAAMEVPARWRDRVALVEDREAGAGPLAGLAAALAACPAEWLLVVAGDTPGLSAPVVELLVAEAAAAGDADAVAPRVDGLAEPLLAVYRARVAPVAAARLAAGRRKVAALLTEAGLQVRWIEEAALRAVDPQLRCLDDVDTPEDLARWQR
jgi:molybdopterin-guanine dinucleotide biosynthesis protein A